MPQALALISDPLLSLTTTTNPPVYFRKKMSTDQVSALAPFQYTPRHAFAIRFTKEELRSMPEFKDKRMRCAVKPGDPPPPEDYPGDYLPSMLMVYYLGARIKDIWPKARRGMVHVKKRDSSSYDIQCAVVLADNSSREAMEIPSPEQLEEIMKLINAPRKPHWYELES